MGMGVSASRISPESSVIRGHGFYGSSEFRNLNPGFGRGQGHPKSFQPSPHLRKGDVFMEAGRLAAEYLVSQGLLPQSALSVKWQNGSLKKQLSEFQEFRSQEGEPLPLPPEGRPSALARLGNAASDAGSGSGRRRFGDDFSSKGRRRAAPFRSYGSEYGREYRRSGSWADRLRSSVDMDVDDNAASGRYHEEEQQIGKDIADGMQISGPNELASKSEDAGDSESELHKYRFQDDDMPLRASSSSAGKDLHRGTNGEFTKSSDDYKNMNAGIGEAKDGNTSDETDKQSTKQELTIQDSVLEVNPSDKSSTDLLKFCKFAKVPTRTRSSLVHKASKVDSVPKTEDGIASDMQPQRGSEVLVEDVSVNASSADDLSNNIHSSKSLESEVSKAQFVTSAEKVVELDSAADIEEGNFEAQSLPDRVSVHDNERESNLGLSGFTSCGSIVNDIGEKRPLQASDTREGTKKPREWIPLPLTKADEFLPLSSLSERKESSPEDKAAPVDIMAMAVDHENLGDVSQFPKAGGDQCVEYAQQKQFFTGSYKICDLNLMGAPDTNENHDNDSIHIYQSISSDRKEAAPVDVDLSMGNSKMSVEYGRHVTSNNEIEVIDLENDCVQENKDFPNAERKPETVYAGLEGFPNNVQNTNDISDVQDGYGLMFSEFLGSEFPNCSSVPGDISSMHNQMSLPNGEGTLADDDSIYMSLEEIPLSFLPAWEQPPSQGYEKPF